ncbi:ABC-type dipeptide/oligopeptide/nickel transport system, ATPase component [Austwickia chelonae]|uniref:Putative ABC transporter ATP-binding protein n=1 Tax=Austwickia chelonae NBRC 105200 TaxID=1184607 RepID=K6WA88_9MICO|nr:ATP-binding cassette domain-containing protein [Austwickia chelonae]GAB78752.1 putative ABC transporter ATP-binding protein [Austwickia chelonae NBRC 105200]SEW35238.1 ABC-type dipeptide/oligopeptide/nickel transport system, ATPase component [Austwickia chelonae]
MTSTAVQVAPQPVGQLPEGRGLRAEKVSARYGRRGPLVLDGVSVTVPPGRITGLRGPSGTGKSTLARVLSGLLAPCSGEVTADGAPVATRRGAMGGRTAMLFQSPRRSCSPYATLRRTILEPTTIRGSRAAQNQVDLESVCHRVGLTDDLLDRLPTQVSLGQLQRACLARVIVSRPDYLICDEATAMLDAASAASVAHLVRGLAEDGVGVLAISHDAPFLEAWADEVCDLSDLGGSAV